MNQEKFLWFFTALGQLKFKIETHPEDTDYGRAWRGLGAFDKAKITLTFHLWPLSELPIITIHNDARTRMVYYGYVESKEMLESLIKNVL